MKLTKYERELEKEIAEGKYISLGPEEVRNHQMWAKEHIARRKEELKAERINIRLTGSDLKALKQRAEVEGLPYQSLIASLIHKYVNGSLIDAGNLAAVRRLLKGP